MLFTPKYRLDDLRLVCPSLELKVCRYCSDSRNKRGSQGAQVT